MFVYQFKIFKHMSSFIFIFKEKGYYDNFLLGIGISLPFLRIMALKLFQSFHVLISEFQGRVVLTSVLWTTFILVSEHFWH